MLQIYRGYLAIKTKQYVMQSGENFSKKSLKMSIISSVFKVLSVVSFIAIVILSIS